MYDAHGGFVVGSEMSRGVSNILVEDCIFSGTDIGVRFKSAMGRGGVVEDITIKNIYMTKIINEAMIFTMGYVLVNIEDEHEGAVTKDREDIPEFKNIKLENIICESAECALKVQGLPELPIHDIELNNVTIKANKGLELSLCENISLNNTKLIINDKEEVYNTVLSSK